MIDKEAVELTNLNRQILFTPEDIGIPKSEAGKMRVELSHKVRKDMEVEAYQLDVLKSWPKIVELAS